MSGNLILRTIISPYSDDVTRNSVMSFSDVDNNFLFLKGNIIYTADTNGNMVTLKRLNGEEISFLTNGEATVTGGTYNPSSGTATFTNSTGGTFNVTGFNIGGSGGDSYWTSGSTGNYSVKTINDSTTNATGNYAVAEGYNTTASGNYSTASGYESIAGWKGFTIDSVVDGLITLNSSYGDVTGEFTGGQVILDTKIYVYNTVTFSSTTNTQILLYDITAIGYNYVADLNNLNSQYADNYVGNSAHAEGRGTYALGDQAHTEGFYTYATGVNSHAEGQGTRASGHQSHAEGFQTTASGYASHAEGEQTIALGIQSHAEGHSTLSSGQSAHAEGSGTRAIGLSSHAEGAYTTANGNFSHAEGEYTIAGWKGFTIDSVVNGVITLNSSYGDVTGEFTNNNLVLDNKIYSYHTVTFSSTTNTEILFMYTTVNNGQYVADLFNLNSEYADNYIGDNSHAEGRNTKALGDDSHAEGWNTIASGNFSHTEGYYTTASGWYSHAEGNHTTAIGSGAHSEGNYTTAVGGDSHAEGYGVKAIGVNSHAEGNYTNAGWRGFTIDSVVDGVITLNSSYGDVTSEFFSNTVVLNNSTYVYNTVTFSSTTNTEILLDDITVNSGQYVADLDNINSQYADNYIGNSSHAEGRLTKALGDYSHAEGYNTTASGYQSHAEGQGTKAIGIISHAEGVGTTAIGFYSHTEGSGTRAIGLSSHAEGSYTTAIGDFSHAEGDNTTAEGNYGSHAEGSYTTASGYFSHAEGQGTTALSDYSHAEGQNTIASGYVSHAEGSFTTANGSYSHAEGYYTTASGAYSHSEGYYTIASGLRSHAEGDSTRAGGKGFTVESFIDGLLILGSSYGDVTSEFTSGKVILDGSIYSYSTVTFNSVNTEIQLIGAFIFSAEVVTDLINNNSNYADIVIGNYPHAEGRLTVAFGDSSHAEGDSTKAIGDYSHAEGDRTTAIGYAAHSEGRETIASGFESHAEGYNTTANGINSHAQGQNTKALGDYSHAGGQDSIANTSSSFIHSKNSVVSGIRSAVLGGQNITGTTNDTVYVPFLNVQSATTNNTLAQVLVIDTNGEVKKRDVSSIGGSVGSSYWTSGSTGNYSVKTINNSTTNATGNYAVAEGFNTLASGDYSHAEGSGTTASGIGSHAEGGWDGNINSPSGSTASGNFSHAEGVNTIASGLYSHAQGRYSTASGQYSHAEGGTTIASGKGSHAEGRQTTASGNYSHAQGHTTTASNYMSSASGSYTVASGNRSHAEGWYTTASGFGTHAQNYGTIAYTDYQTTMGKFNTTGNTSQLLIIGNGTNTSTRSNALRVSNNGNLNIAGTLTQGSADYAEFFESLNGDRLPFGTVVELSNGKIIECQDYNNAIGVISSKPMIVGNAEDGTGDEWVGKYLKDEWGNFITEEYEYVGLDNNNNEVLKTDIRNKLNPNFDPSTQYTKREDRPEWNIVGLLGQIRVLKNQQIPNRWIKLYDINDDIAMYLVR